MIASAEVPDRSRLVPLSFGRVYVTDRGPGPEHDGAPPVVLLHGLLVTHYTFRKVIDDLARTRRVIAVDLPGCGDSDRPEPADVDHYSVRWLATTVRQLLATLDVPTVDLLGHSLGAAVAAWIAAEHHGVVRRLALVDAVAFSLELPLLGRLALVPTIGPLMFKTLYRESDLRRYLGDVFSTPELLEPTAVHVYWDRLGRDGGREAAYAMLRQLAHLDGIRERLTRIEAPTLVLWGDRDRLLPLATGQRIAELIPDATLSVIDGCGHSPAEECPDEFTARTLAHLDATASPS